MPRIKPSTSYLPEEITDLDELIILEQMAWEGEADAAGARAAADDTYQERVAWTLRVSAARSKLDGVHTFAHTRTLPCGCVIPVDK